MIMPHVWRTWVTLVGIMSGATPVVLDECGVFGSYIGQDGLVCGDDGMCGSTTTSCQSAYETISANLAVPFPSEQGLLNMPQIHIGKHPVEDDSHIGEVTEDEAADVKSTLEQLQEFSELLLGVLSDQYPRILFSEGTAACLSEMHSLLEFLAPDERIRAHTNRSLRDTHAVYNLMYFIVNLAELAIHTPHPQTSGYLPNLIPYLHIVAEAGYLLGLEARFMVNFWSENIDLVLTISQFKPLYIDVPHWRFWFVENWDGFWQATTRERPMLDLQIPGRDARSQLQASVCLGSTVTNCLKEFRDRIYEGKFLDIHGEIHKKHLDRLMAIFAHILYLVSTADDVQTNLIQRFCDHDTLFLRKYYTLPLMSPVTMYANRVVTVLLDLCGGHTIRVASRVNYLSQVVGGNRMGLHAETITPYGESCDEFLEHLGTGSVLSLHSLVGQIWDGESTAVWVKEKTVECVPEYIAPFGGLYDHLTPSMRRGFGRAIALTLLNGEYFEGSSEETWHEYFFGSDYVRKGFSDVFLGDVFQNMFTPKDIPDFASALRCELQ